MKVQTVRYLPDKMLCDLARRFLRQQAEVLAGHLDGAKTRDDVEDVHQVRVACRRMRAGLAFFGDCFEEQKADRWRGQLKKMLKRFGPARDCDVQIAFLEGLLADLGAKKNNANAPDAEPLIPPLPEPELNVRLIRPGMTRLLLRLRQQRDGLQAGLVKAVRRLQRQRLTMNLHLETERLLYEVEHTDAMLQTIRFYDRAADLTAARLAEVLDKRGSLADPADQAGHHNLRIAVKKLRYTLEVCDMALDGRLRRTIKQLKRLQTLLGDLHDCDVWDAQIEVFIGQETERTMAYFGHTRPMRRFLPGLHHLQAWYRRRRADLFSAAAVCAADLEAGDFWTRIGRAVQGQTDVPDAPEDGIDDGALNGGQ